MGEIEIIKPEQRLLLEEFQKNTFITSHFYFTGGTALSLYYLQHRESIDIDLFSENRFNPEDITVELKLLAEKHDFFINYVPLENVHSFHIDFSNKASVKIDFVYHPYKRIERSKVINNLEIDSLMDIAINKLLAAEQRTQVKDFVDLYFLLGKYTIWDLLHGIRVKYRIKLEPLIVASDFMKVEDFTYLPKMIKPLDLDHLKTFYRQAAKDLGKKIVE
jgi:predicted nucleotidyltransferase component of viral defense system